MNRIALIIGETFIYWSTIVQTLAVVSVILLFLGLYLGKSGNVLAAAVIVPLAMTLSLFFARLLHWYCLEDSYESVVVALTDFTSGGYALAGVFAGCILSAGILRILEICENLPEMLDCMSIAGAAGIAVGRLASFFSTSDRGQIMTAIRELPWAYPVLNSVSGAVEYRLATFLLQAIAAGCIFLGLFLFYKIGRKRQPVRDGDATLIFFLLYCTSQAILDSTRYDSLFFRSNGFVSVVQVLCAAGIVLTVVVFAVRLVKFCGFRMRYLGLWLVLAALLGGAGYMEYHVQRHADQAVMAYSVMTVCLLVLSILTLRMRYIAERDKRSCIMTVLPQ